jgi:hypothetical protein
MEALHKRTIQPDINDHRDHQFCLHHGDKSPQYNHITCPVRLKEQMAEDILPRVDLRKSLTSEIINQGLLNSCSACAIAVAAELYLVKDNQPFINENISNIDASQMFIYYNERVIEDKVDLNAPFLFVTELNYCLKTVFVQKSLGLILKQHYPKALKILLEQAALQKLQQR